MSSANLGHKVTAIIKTFERPKALDRLVRSIKRFYPGMPIIVGDDSFRPRPRGDVIYVQLEPDRGLSAGRNELLARVETPYFVLLDDDLEFWEDTDLAKLLDVVENDGFALAAGNFMLWRREAARPWFGFGRPRIVFDPQPWNGTIYRNGDRMLLTPGYAEEHEKYFVCDIVNNFFVARTEDIRGMGGWDEDLKVYEHWDFFIRFKDAGLKAAYCPEVTIRHWHTRTRRYKKFRQRNEFRELAMRKHGLETFVNYEGQRFILDADGNIGRAA